MYAVKRKTERYEMRRYEEGAVWAKVTISGAEYDAAISQGFEELFAYIQGANREKEKVPMAAPVRVTITPGQGPTCASNFTVAFFVPFAYQSKPATPLPDSNISPAWA